MPFDARDEFWNVVFETFYDACYEEVLADALVARWQLVDDITKVAVAVTASGSAVAGWALWSQPSFKIFWIAIAGVSAVAAIVHAALGVPSRLKAWSDSQRDFCSLRTDLETLRQQMRVDPDFPLDGCGTTHTRLRERLKVGMDRRPNDLLDTRRLRNRLQAELHQRLANLIEERS